MTDSAGSDAAASAAAPAASPPAQQQQQAGVSTMVDGLLEVSKPLLALHGHERAISVLRFNVDHAAAVAALAGSIPADLPLFLATASQDTTARVWELARGRCLMTLSQHIHPVNGLSWSPLAASVLSAGAGAPAAAEALAAAVGSTSGGVSTRQLISTYSHERVHVWAAADGSLVRTFRADAAATDVAWGSAGQIGVASADGSVYVLDAQQPN